MEGTNLLGKSHKKYVQEQVKLRQEKLGKSSKDSTDISWMNGKTSWVRLASSVNIENSTIRVPSPFQELYENVNYKAGGDTTGHQNVSPDINNIINFNLQRISEQGEVGIDIEVPTGKQRLELLGLDDKWMGNTLARNLVLIGGNENISADQTKTKRKGVSPTTFPAYQGRDFGLVAMPGIESVDIKSKSMGSLKEAKIKIRVNDAIQLELIETVYLRLGYSMFLEWGNSSYFRNDGEYVKGASAEPGLIYDFLSQETPTQQEIDRVLALKASINNNLADIGSFVGSLASDGSSPNVGRVVGAVSGAATTDENVENVKKEIAEFEKQIDSVQVLQQKIEEERKRSCGNYDALFGKVTNFDWEFDPDGFYSVNLTIISWGDIIESLNINAYYPDVVLDIDESGNIKRDEIDRKNSSALESFIYLATLPSTDTYINSFLVATYENTTYQPIKKSIKAQINSDVNIFWFGFTPTNDSEASEYSELLNYDRGATNSAGKVISCNAQMGDTEEYFYLRFGDLLDFIKSKLLLYNGKAPIIDIDTRPGANFCYNPKINVSADPSKMMIRRKLPFDAEGVLPLEELNLVVGTNYEYVEGIFDTVFTVDEQQIDTRIEEFDAKVPGTDIIGGDIMNLYFEKEYLYSVIDSIMDLKTGKLSLFNFIKELLNTANDCLGGVNNLDLRIVDDRILQIYDQTPLYGVKLGESNEDSQRFNIYGVQENNGSFVTNFGLKTELTNEFATTVAIGAQANGSAVGEDATFLSKWNFGLIDRFIPKKIDSIARNLEAKEKDFEELKALTSKILTFWYAYQIQYVQYDGVLSNINRYRFDLMGTERFVEYTDLQKKFFQALIKLETNSQSANPNRLSNQIGMLPINLNLEMDGISGIRIYDQINVDTRFLPSYYPNYLIFIIKGISHTFSGNRWITKIDTIAQPKVQFQEDLRLYDKFKMDFETLSQDEETPEENIDDPAVIYNGLLKVGTKGTTPPAVTAFKAAGIKNGEVPSSIKLDLRDTDIPLRNVSQPFLFADAYGALLRLHQLVVDAGYTMTITSADRTLEKQKELRKSLGSGAAVPGTSNHGWAIAIDIGELYQEVGGSKDATANLEGRKRSELYKFLAINGPLHGWYNPWALSDGGTDEMWHWEWWGTPTTTIPGLDYENLPDDVDLSEPIQQWELDLKRQLFEDANR